MSVVVGFTDAASLLETIDSNVLQRCLVLTGNTFLLQYRREDTDGTIGFPRKVLFRWDADLNGVVIGNEHLSRLMAPPPSDDVRSDPYFMMALGDFLRSAYADIKKLARMQSGVQW